MNPTIISIRELYNDGSTIYIYYNHAMGSYVSYGISAFNVSKFIRPTLSYSEDFLMPVAYYDENSFMLLKDRFTIVKDQTGDWELRTPVAFDEELYKKWVEMIIPTNT